MGEEQPPPDLSWSDIAFRDFITAVSDHAIILLDSTGHVRSWNVGAERLLGYREDAIVGAYFGRFFLPEDQQAGRPEAELHQAATLGQAADENWLVRADGSRFWASGTTSAVKSATGQLQGFTKIVRDLTEQRRVEAGLRAAHAETQRILEHMADGFVAVDRAWRYTYVNRRAEAVLGKRREELLGRTLWEVYPLFAERWEGITLRQAMAEGVPIQQEYYLAETGRWIDGRVSPSPDGLAIYFLDITERKHAEAEREALLGQALAARAEAEAAVQARDAFLGMAAHELRTPLTVLKGYLQRLIVQLRHPTLDPAQLAASVPPLERQLERLERLVSYLLDLTRIQHGQLELRRASTDVAALARQVLERLQQAPERAARHRFVLEAPTPVLAEVDAERLEQVLNNLLSNAVKYSPAGGEVRVQVQEQAGQVVVAVHDEGIGMDAETQAQLFQPFSRAATVRGQIEGLGLGLYISQQIVARHGGTISVTSAPGVGSTFTVQLPISPPPAPGTERAATS